jgi:hypothetical protein
VPEVTVRLAVQVEVLLEIILFLAQSHQTVVDMGVALAPVLVLVVPVDRVAVLTILPAEAQEIRHQHRQHREVMEGQG